MLQYPVNLQLDDNGTLLMTFPDVPEAVTFGGNDKDALHRASEALDAALSIYMDRRKDIPQPSRSRKPGKPLVGLPALSEAKVSLYMAMCAQGVRKADLARRLGWQKTRIDRLLDLNHASRLEQLEAAFAVLDKRLVISVQNAA